MEIGCYLAFLHQTFSKVSEKLQATQKSLMFLQMDMSSMNNGSQASNSVFIQTKHWFIKWWTPISR